MLLYQCNCSVCLKPVFRDIRRIHEAKKRGWKVYCSATCLSQARNKKRKFRCANPSCQKIVYRHPSEISTSGRVFCSKSCAAIVYNAERKTRKYKLKTQTGSNSKTEPKTKSKKCFNPNCQNKIPITHKYCSNICQGKITAIPKSEYKKRVTNEISNFYLKYERIPLKRELPTQYRTVPPGALSAPGTVQLKQPASIQIRSCSLISMSPTTVIAAILSPKKLSTIGYSPEIFLMKSTSRILTPKCQLILRSLEL